MTWTMIVAFSLALLVNAGSPGPSIAALVSRVITNGFRDVLPFLAAMWVGEIVWMTLAVSGLSSLAQAFGTGFSILRVAGAAYLIYLAWKMWRAPSDWTSGNEIPRSGGVKMFGAGLMVTFGNPKIMVFYLALVPTIVPLHQMTVVTWAELAAVMLIILMAIDLSWSLLATRARKLLASRRARRAANRVSAVTMAGAAVVVATR